MYFETHIYKVDARLTETTKSILTSYFILYIISGRTRDIYINIYEFIF